MFHHAPIRSASRQGIASSTLADATIKKENGMNEVIITLIIGITLIAISAINKKK